MVILVAALQPLQDGQRLLLRWFIDNDGQEPSGEGFVLLDVLPVQVVSREKKALPYKLLGGN